MAPLLVAPLNTSAVSPTVLNDSLRDVVALHTCRVPVRSDDIDDISWWCTRLQLKDSGPPYIYIARVVVVADVFIKVYCQTIMGVRACVCSYCTGYHVHYQWLRVLFQLCGGGEHH